MADGDKHVSLAGLKAVYDHLDGNISNLKSAVITVTRNVFTIETADGKLVRAADGGSGTNGSSCTTGFIPITSGASVTLAGLRLNASAAVYAYSNNLVNAERKERIDDGTTFTGEKTFTNIPLWAKYIRATGANGQPVTGYEEIRDVNFGKGSDVLNGKKWVACGDSFTAGSFSASLTNDYTFTDNPYYGKYKVYPYWIGRRNKGLTVINEAISGSTMGAGENGVNPFSGGEEGSERYKSIPADADYITLMFGINDSGHGVPLGEVTDTTNATFCGAWNVVLEYLITNYPAAHIGMIIGPGMQTTTAKTYADAEIALAKKWGIPYLNFQYESGGGKIPLMLRTSNPDVSQEAKALRNAQQYVNPSEETPNYHPNETAHEIMSHCIEDWLKTI